LVVVVVGWLLVVVLVVVFVFVVVVVVVLVVVVVVVVVVLLLSFLLALLLGTDARAQNASHGGALTPAAAARSAATPALHTPTRTHTNTHTHTHLFDARERQLVVLKLGRVVADLVNLAALALPEDAQLLTQRGALLGVSGVCAIVD
jgi:hypothetical protein